MIDQGVLCIVNIERCRSKEDKLIVDEIPESLQECSYHRGVHEMRSKQQIVFVIILLVLFLLFKYYDEINEVMNKDIIVVDDNGSIHFADWSEKGV